jgi:hypothetical protein
MNTKEMPASQAGEISLGNEISVNRLGYGAMCLTGLSCRGVPSIPWATTCNEPHAETVPAGLLHTGSANHLQREHTSAVSRLPVLFCFCASSPASSLLSSRT